MSALRETPTREVTPITTRRSYVYESILGIAGVLAAGVGAWMYYVPADWFLGGLAEAWYFGMFIAAGVLLAAASGYFARMAYVDDRAMTTRAVVATVLALAALGGAIPFAVILIIRHEHTTGTSPAKSRCRVRGSLFCLPGGFAAA